MMGQATVAGWDVVNDYKAMLKDSGFNDIVPQLTIITLYAIVLNSLAVWSYKKTI